MGIFDKLRHELIDIIEWIDDTSDTMVWRFPRYENEIKYGAKLIVRESQAAAFISEGKLADVFPPGTYTLQTQNMPILSTLKGWKYGFESPFKSEVYFVSTRTFTDRKWGTKNPIMMRDPEFGPIRLRAFGTYNIKVTDPAMFLRQIAGTDGQFTVDEVDEQLRNMVVSRFADALGNAKVAALDLAGNYDKLGRFITAQMGPDFGNFGLQIVNLLIENISLPPEVEAAIDKRSSMGVIGNMAAYTQFQVANSIPDAAKQGGGIAGAGVGLAMGYNMANQMAQAMNTPQQQSPAIAQGGQGGPPPIPGAPAFYIALNGSQVGPLAPDALNEKVSAGQLKRETLVWKNGMAAWAPASTVPELQKLFESLPPPLPPAQG